jgi:hypothetical protein
VVGIEVSNLLEIRELGGAQCAREGASQTARQSSVTRRSQFLDDELLHSAPEAWQRARELFEVRVD